MRTKDERAPCQCHNQRLERGVWVQLLQGLQRQAVLLHPSDHTNSETDMGQTASNFETIGGRSTSFSTALMSMLRWAMGIFISVHDSRSR
jgi:hypothetical protein